MSKHGDDFYVKTYGCYYGINGEKNRVKHGQKWMVYWHKKCIQTFCRKEDADKTCRKLNADREANIRALRLQMQNDKRERIEKICLSALHEQAKDLKKTILGVAEDVTAIIKKIEDIQSREERQ